MTLSTQPLPTLGLPNSTEDSKVRSLLSEIQGIVNGNIDAANLAAAAITSAKFAPTIGLTTTLVTPTSLNTYVDGSTLTFTPAAAGRSLFIGAVMGQLNMGTNSSQTASLKLVVDGVDQAFIPSVTSYNSGTLTPGFPFTLAGVWVPSLTVGSHTVKTQWLASNASGSSATSAFLLRLELGN